MDNLSILKSALTMSSTEIATLTGKDHADVLKDIRRIFAEVDIDAGKFSGVYLGGNNQERPCFNLPRRECDLIIAGYSAKYRLAIIDRWQELENQQYRLPDFNDPAAAAIAWAEQYKIAPTALATKAEIGSRREATAMNTASQAVKQVKRLEVELDKSKDYLTIKRMEMIYHGQKFKWRLLKDASINLGIESIDVFDANYGTVKAYHRDVWLEAYALDISEGVSA